MKTFHGQEKWTLIEDNRTSSNESIALYFEDKKVENSDCTRNVIS